MVISAAARLAATGALVVAAAMPASAPLRARPSTANVRDVRIRRDLYGVPHILGRTEADAAYGLGYAHAEDDYATIQATLVASRGQRAVLPVRQHRRDRLHRNVRSGRRHRRETLFRTEGDLAHRLVVEDDREHDRRIAEIGKQFGGSSALGDEPMK